MFTERAVPVLSNLGFAANGLSGRKKRKTDAGKKDGREEKSGKHERNRERVAGEHESATRRRDGRAGREQWHLTLSESGHVHCSPLILVLAVALSNASIGGSRRFECSVYFPLRLLYLRASLSAFIEKQWEKKSRRDRKDPVVEVSLKKTPWFTRMANYF